MPRFYLRLMLIPIALFTAVLILIRAQPYDDHELRQLLLPDGCPAPCFMGIRPRITTVDEAIELLQTNKWVKQVNNNTFNNVGSVFWTWSNQIPKQITRNTSGEIWVIDKKVQSIRFFTNIQLGELRLILSVPDMEIADEAAVPNRNYKLYWAFYNQEELTIQSGVLCNMFQPFRNTVLITLGKLTNDTSDHINTLSTIFRACRN